MNSLMEVSGVNIRLQNIETGCEAVAQTLRWKITDKIIVLTLSDTAKTEDYLSLERLSIGGAVPARPLQRNTRLDDYNESDPSRRLTLR